MKRKNTWSFPPHPSGKDHPCWKGGKDFAPSKTSFYNIWENMRQRCTNSNRPDYKNYGGRGISYNLAWDIFDNFKHDMFATWQKGLTIDRINNSKGYSKENCRWADRKTQNNNRRDNHFLEYKGIRDTVTNWSIYFGLKRGVLMYRLNHGWDMGKSLIKGTIFE